MNLKHSLPLFLSSLFLASCAEKEPTLEDSIEEIPHDSQPLTDADGDGVAAEDGDCDDADAAVYPGRTEDCNGLDDNCNDIIDEGFDDTDADGLADCMDTEDCDGLDNDGDGGVDEGFEDADGDGVADCIGVEECDGVDNDADGLVDEGHDADGDGVNWCDDDCDDDDADSYPGNEEIDGDGKDNDCDGMIDESAWAEGTVFFSELMINPARVNDPRGEYVEIYNPGEEDVSLDGLTLQSDDGDSYQIPADAGLIVAAGSYVTIGSNSDEASNGDVELDHEYSGISLANESDNIQLVAEDVIIDEVSWDDGATMPDPDGASIGVDPWFMSAELNDDANNWCAALDSWATAGDAGSPGVENELCSHVDHDADGYTRDEGDCDDSDPRVYPGAPEFDAGVDNDCDGDAEAMPVAVADYDSTTSSLEHCDMLYLVGSGSYDPDSSGSLTYSWELTSAPAGSAATTSDITTSTDADPTFTPDASGTYVFTLGVNDGGADSYPVTLTVTVTSASSNTVPVADAGEDDSDSDSVTCQSWSYGATYVCDDCADVDFELDGTGSSDAESDDWLTYAWSVTSGSSYGTLDDSTSSTPTLTVSGVEATYGSTNSQEIEASLTVTDCFGASSAADTVTLTYDCTGS
ncbi:MAG: hypothetical protein GY913_14940 [Proteobacteria bacterium]|nr:hypothetical protein [Pseudomonadota bacterium]MCP4918207.1 hypothetical protein [Pseudomonadota bacterium]